MDQITVIRSFTEARQAEATYFARRDENTLTLVQDTPTTVEELLQLVQEIAEAMMHTQAPWTPLNNLRRAKSRLTRLSPLWLSSSSGH